MSLIQSDKKRVVVGLGITGQSTMRHLLRQGMPFAATDSQLDDADCRQLKQSFPQAVIVSSEHAQPVIDGADEIYLSPGIALDSPLVSKAVANGALVTGDLELFAAAVNKPIVAVTGTNGKSTVVSLIGEVLSAQGMRVAVAGNIGDAMLDAIDESVDCYVLELSSFQLERVQHFAPRVAIILNVTADHLDRHKTLLNYQQAKQRIYKQAQCAVYNRDDNLTQPLGREGLELKSFGSVARDPDEYGLAEHDGRQYIVRGFDRLIDVDNLQIKVRHNAMNAMVALIVGEVFGFSAENMLPALRAFNPLRHRCETVAVQGGVRFINDSKATNVGSALAAIRGLKSSITGKLVLIAGGLVKGADMTPLAQALAAIESRVVLMGRDAPAIKEALQAQSYDLSNVHEASSMQAAVEKSIELSESGDCVLLSPACASMDMFESYRQRGDAFIAVLARSGVTIEQGLVQ